VSSSPEEEIRELVALATLGEGVLRDKDEHRILKVALARGVPPQVAKATIDAALAAAGARRPEKSVDLTSSDSATMRALEKKTEDPDEMLTSDAIKKAIQRKLDKPPSSTSNALPLPETTPLPALAKSEPPEEEVAEEVAVLAEIVAPPAPEKPLGICAGCLAEVFSHDVAAGRAQREPDGRLHCRNCLSRLEAGLLCDVCYRPIDRTLLADGRAVAKGDRAYHAACVAPPPEPPAPPPTPVAAASHGVILGPSASEISSPPSSSAIQQPKTTSSLGAKCAGCYVTLTRVAFDQGRARRIEGVAYCDACAQRASRGRG